MTHAAKIGELAEGLITSITGKSSDDASFKSFREQTIKGLKDQSHARTNQFAVRDKYTGLVEKFGVLNRDDLAEAFQSRLDDLPAKSKWLPEILSLFLELSDRPLEKTKLEDLQGPTDAGSPPEELTWDEIVADDPLDEDGIWDDVERGYHSSGDDATLDEDDAEVTTSTQATSLGDEDFEALARLYVVQPDHSLLGDLRQQKRQLDGIANGEDSGSLSELVVIRETLTMLHGLPTSLYRSSSFTGEVTVCEGVAVATTAKSTTQEVLRHCANLGSRLNSLRQWTDEKDTAAFVQSMQAATRKLLKSLTEQLAAFEQSFLTPGSDSAISLIDMRSEVDVHGGPLVLLSETVRLASAQAQSQSSPFYLLDAIYHQACLAHTAGDTAAFADLSSVLLAGLRTYLRPLEQRLRDGTLPTRDAALFFVEEAAPDCGLGEVWQKRFVLRMLDSGRPCAPVFMMPFIDQAFATGKSRAFMNMLKPGMEDADVELGGGSHLLDSDAVHQQLEAEPLLPFPQLLEQTIGDWIAQIGTDCTMTLRSKLLHDHGLLATVTALEHVYFSKSGDSFQSFAETLFERMRRRPKTWHDRFMLTKLAQSTLGSAPAVATECITAVVPGAGRADIAGSVTSKLSKLEMHYALPWPIQNVTRSKLLPTHASAVCFLLQVQLALSLLRPQVFDLRRYHTGTDMLSDTMTYAMNIRLRLLCIAETLQTHITTTASVLHSKLRLNLREANGVDAMTVVWAEYEKKLQVGLLLSPNLAPIRDAITDILELVERFANVWSGVLENRDRPKESALEGVGEELLRSLSFVMAGLRGIGRAGGEVELEVLAERLSWCGKSAGS